MIIAQLGALFYGKNLNFLSGLVSWLVGFNTNFKTSNSHSKTERTKDGVKRVSGQDNKYDHKTKLSLGFDTRVWSTPEQFDKY